jgi:hypothetical protein
MRTSPQGGHGPPATGRRRPRPRPYQEPASGAPDAQLARWATQPRAPLGATFPGSANVQQKHLTGLEVLGCDSALTQSLEATLLRLSFATNRHNELELQQRRLSTVQKTDLLVLLSGAEAQLTAEERMRVVRLSLGEAVRALPNFEEARRQPFVAFRVD